MFSLSDRFFLPLALAALAGLVSLALWFRPLGQDPVITDTSFVMEGAALAQLIPGPGIELVFDPDAIGGPVIRASATADFETGGAMSVGVGAIIPPSFENRVIGQRVEIAIDMRATDPDLTEVHMGYFLMERGGTGWRTMTIDGQFAPRVLRHQIPESVVGGNSDWIGLWPDAEGAGRVVIIRRIEVRILPEAST